MHWISISFDTDCDAAEVWTEALLAAGALSASIEDADAGTPEEKPQFGEPGSSALTAAWTRSRIAALFEAGVDLSAVLAEVARAHDLGAVPDFTLTPVAEQNWVQLTQAQFAPIAVSSRLWIVPSWHLAPDPDAINLVLDPGMAFGTGSHPTTRLCLEWLERTVQPGSTLLDYGCGSGILAIAAAKLGAASVTGVDIDPQALLAARANAERNGVSARFLDAQSVLPACFDMVVANILANPLKVLAPALCAHVRPGGCLALSGILEAQAEDLIARYAPYVMLRCVDVRESWVCLAGVKSC